jgi:hypothetical protein
MDARGYRQCAPSNRDPSVTALPAIDFSSSYVLRAIEQFPKQGSKAPWRLYQNYARDILTLKFGALEDGVLVFSETGSATAFAGSATGLAGDDGADPIPNDDSVAAAAVAAPLPVER